MKIPFKIIITALVLGFTFSSCVKDCPNETSVPVELKQAPDYKLFSVRDFAIEPETGELIISFFQSARLYKVGSSSPGFEQIFEKISESKRLGNVVNVGFGSQGEITDVIPASTEEIETYKAGFATESDLREPYDLVVHSTAELVDIFEFCKAQNCEDGNAVIDFCIPFQYKVDGCYARAHKMRQIMHDYYGVECRKVFSFGGMVNSLAVNAGDCCIFWGWHVAPLVKVYTPQGFKDMVIDPSLFDEPVTLTTWLKIQSDESCDQQSVVGSYEITPGSYYFSDGYKDPNYMSTNLTLQMYANLETCF